MGEWGSWSNCDKNCGGGFQTATRIPIQRAKNGGAECPENVTIRPCNTNECPFTFKVKIENPDTTICLPVRLTIRLSKNGVKEHMVYHWSRVYGREIEWCKEGTPKDGNPWILKCLPDFPKFSSLDTKRNSTTVQYREGYTIDWGDGSDIDAHGDIHTYKSGGIYTVRIYGGSNYMHNLSAESLLLYEPIWRNIVLTPEDNYWNPGKSRGETEKNIIQTTKSSIISFNSYGSFKVTGNNCNGFDNSNSRGNFSINPDIVNNPDNIESVRSVFPNVTSIPTRENIPYKTVWNTSFNDCINHSYQWRDDHLKLFE
jgi:hypothetical protein